MRIFVAGATGAVGRRLVPLLVEAGHEVVGTTSTPAKARGDLVVVDLLDRDAVIAAVEAAAPDAVVHEATALAGMKSLRRFERAFALTNRLRTEGTDNLLEAARRAGVERVVAQSYAGWANGAGGPAVHTEDDPLDPDPPAQLRTTLAAIRHLEDAVVGAGGLALRYGGLYGPGTGIEPGGPWVETLRKRQFPVVGDGGGVWSWLHVEDAAAATLAAIEHGAPGIYNVVDDDPAPVRDWLPYLAEVVGAPPPRHFPVWLGRIVAGEHGVAMMTSIRGSSNAKAKRELGWRPLYPSWREGFAEVFGARTAPDHGSPGVPTEISGSPSKAA
ncbi:MAG: NAD-dependent epimerase/dehydratase family protein [Gaiellaceae bacterium]